MELPDNEAHPLALTIAANANAETTSFWIALFHTFEYTNPVPSMTTLCPFAMLEIVFGN